MVAFARAVPSLVTTGKDYNAGIKYPTTLLGLGASSANNTASGVIHFTPFWCRFTHTFTKISFQNGTSVNGNKFHLGIYNDTGGMPSSLLLDAGEITVADTNTSTERSITISQQLVAGKLYWLAYLGNTSSNVYIVGTQNVLDMIMETGLDALPATSAFGFLGLETFAYAALPANATGVTGGSGNNVKLWMTG